MKIPVFTGANVAIVTPLTEKGVDFEKFGELIEFQIANGINAITVCGTTGESATLSHEEHCEVIEYSVKKVAGRACRPIVLVMTTSRVIISQRSILPFVRLFLPFTRQTERDSNLLYSISKAASKINGQILGILPTTINKLCEI